MTPKQIDEALALFDRVNPGLVARQIDHTPRDAFKRRLSEGPGIALGAVIDACLPEGWEANIEYAPAGSLMGVGEKMKGGMYWQEEMPLGSHAHPALAMVRAISAALDMGEG